MRLPRGSTPIGDYGTRALSDDQVELVEAPENGNRAARGLVTGVLVGAGLWAAILVLTGVIKL